MSKWRNSADQRHTEDVPFTGPSSLGPLQTLIPSGRTVLLSLISLYSDTISGGHGVCNCLPPLCSGTHFTWCLCWAIHCCTSKVWLWHTMCRKSKLQFSLEVVGFVISFVSLNTLLWCYLHLHTYAIHRIVKAHYIRSMVELVVLLCTPPSLMCRGIGTCTFGWVIKYKTASA